VERPQRAHDEAEDVVAAQVAHRDVDTLDEPSDEAPRVGEERDDLGTDPGVGGDAGRAVLVGAVDPEERGVGARHAQDVTDPVHRHDVVPVRDAALERFDLEVGALPPGDRADHAIEQGVAHPRSK
jgi:hypothetical protein